MGFMTAGRTVGDASNILEKLRLQYTEGSSVNIERPSVSKPARVNRSTSRAIRVAVSLLVLLVFAALGIWKPELIVPVLLATGIVMVAVFAIFARRWANKTMTQLKNLSRRIEKLQLTSNTTSTPVPRDRAPAKNRRRTEIHPLAKELVESGIFSVAFYEGIAGKRFPAAQDAASHYLTFGLREFIPPNPYVNINMFPRRVKNTISSGQTKRVFEHMTSPFAEAFGPAFHPRFVERNANSDKSLIGQFVSSVDDTTLLPVPESSPLAGVKAQTYADTIVSRYKSLRDEQAVKGSRVSEKWDVELEAAWKAELGEVDEHAQPLVSVVMPVKNRAVLVEDAIASVQAQSYKNWSLIVIDDHSTDDTLSVLHEMAKRDARIIVLSNTGAGVSAARNVGIQAATGEYTGFLDSDNTWEPDYLECMIRGMLRDGIDWAYSASRIIGGSAYPIAYMAYEGDRNHLLFRNHIDINVMIVKADLLERVKGFDESLRRWVDYDLVLRMTEHSRPVLMPFIGCNYDHSADRNDRITVKESNRWRGIVCGKNLANWRQESNKERVPGRISIIISTFDDSYGTIDAIESFVERGNLDDIEVVVVDNGSTDQHARMLIHDLSCRANIQYIRLSRNFGEPTGNNLGFLESSGEYVFFANSCTRMRSGSLNDLTSNLDDETVIGVNPLLLKPNDTILSAGLVWAEPRSMPLYFLEDHPREDVEAVAGYGFSAASGTGLVMRASDFAVLKGFDPVYHDGMEDIDLTLRARDQRQGTFQVVPRVVLTVEESAVRRHWGEISGNQQIFMDKWRYRMPYNDRDLFTSHDFEIIDVGMDSSIEHAEEAGTKVTLGRVEGSPRRWAIKNPARMGLRGDAWGDTHFIDSFAQSLRQEGQEVVTFRWGAHLAPSTKFDDVNLVIRGLHRSSPNPGKVNILWIISHPEKVTAGELAAFDIVYAASNSWARWAKEEFGIEVRPLLQATDPTRFNYLTRTEPPASDVVFVGGHYESRERKVVLDALESGVDLKVYGPGWQGVVPESKMGGLYVANDQLADVYRDAQFVLADHWDHMASEGFIQNRIFDAVASGCRVITDPVKDLREVFGEEVLEANNADDIRRHVEQVLNEDIDTAEALRRKAAESVLANHTFNARARQVIADVESLEAVRKRAV